MPKVPNTASTRLMFPVVISNTRRMRLRLEIQSNRGFKRAAATGNQAFTTSAPTSGNSMSRISERAISAGLTETPGIKNGRRRGRNPTVTTISRTIKPTAKGRLPLAIWANFGRNGAPPAAPNSSRPIRSGSSSRSSAARAAAASGIKAKLASSASTTSRALRSGPMISLTVRPKPIASMLEGTKIRTATEAACWSSCISVQGTPS